MKALKEKLNDLYTYSSGPLFIVGCFMFHLWLMFFFVRIGIIPVAVLSGLSCMVYLVTPFMRGDDVEQNAIFLIFCEISVFSLLSAAVLSLKSGFFLYCLPLPLSSYIEIANAKRKKFLFVTATIAMLLVVPLADSLGPVFKVYRDIMEPYDYMFLRGNFFVVVASYGLNVYAFMRMHEKKTREIKFKSEHDPLTGMYNRNFFNQYVMAYEKKEKLLGAFIMFDIDNFKQINDQYGHDVGDMALVSTTGIAKNHIRSEDVFVRWGGEEFVLFIKDMSLQRAKTKAEEIRRAVESIPYYKDKILTISIGVTVIHPDEHITAALKRVDENLYTAKTTGKNRVVATE